MNFSHYFKRPWNRAPLICLGLGITLATIGCGETPAERVGLNRDEDGTNWPAYGRTYSETHDSPLNEINVENVSGLGLVSYTDLSDDAHGATVPLAIDGIVYLTIGHSKVHAVDAASGNILWKYDPEVASAAGEKLKFQWGARGLAYWNGKVFVGTLDGRLIAIDASSGEKVWSVDTTQPNDARYITGAPRVFKGLVVIGHGGADVGPVRGYVTAYEAETGAEKWRFHTVPGNPADGFENEAMERASKTWTGEWWKYGGGGTVWNAITYDDELETLYLGTGNGAPHNQRIRSPQGGDNLYLCSIVALRAKSGEYLWHYQVNPGETWDYNSAMDITLATLDIDGKKRKVILHAPKNGFFYVIDRTNGELISAEKFADNVTWADKIDLKTGRPVETAIARQNGALIWPGSIGAHSWAPMAFNPNSNLVFIPTIEMPGVYTDPMADLSQWRFEPGKWNTGYAAESGPIPADAGTSYLQAYDPIHQKQVWRVPLPGAWPGGVLSTSGGLVFHGRPDGKFVAHNAANGENLWTFDAGLGISGAPITFLVEGKQYVAVVAGWGGAGAAYFGDLSGFGWQSKRKRNHLFMFALGGAKPSPEQADPIVVTPIIDPDFVIDETKAAAGASLFSSTCMACHGGGAVASGYAPDLRASESTLDAEWFRTILREGPLELRGMPKYDDLQDHQMEELRHFIRQRAREDFASSNATSSSE